MRRTRGLTALGAMATLAYVVHYARGRARQREPRADAALPTARFEPVPFPAGAPAGPDAMVAPMDEATSAAPAVTSADSNGSPTPAPTLASSASEARSDRLGPIELPPKRRISAAVLVTLAAIAAVAAIALAATAVAASRDSADQPTAKPPASAAVLTPPY